MTLVARASRPLVLALLLAACNSGGGAWTKAGADQAGAGQAYDECKELADTAVQTQASVDQDISASRGGDWGRSSIGRIETRSLHDRTGERTGRILDSCMKAKGFATAP